ncbi:MAG: DUF4783 domain-containing protein [Tannerella sp.]|jgi:hypothetical protein|nr:DUF4783 domain-containing protein [Tannerella sp.]
MGKILLTLTATLAFWSVNAADVTPITEAFRTGKAEALKGKMSAEIDIVVPDGSKKVAGEQAVAILDNFFKSHKVSGFTVVHNADKNESGFIVGKLSTDKGEFRVNITYTASKDGKILIQIIRIE